MGYLFKVSNVTQTGQEVSFTVSSYSTGATETATSPISFSNQYDISIEFWVHAYVGDSIYTTIGFTRSYPNNTTSTDMTWTIPYDDYYDWPTVNVTRLEITGTAGITWQGATTQQYYSGSVSTNSCSFVGASIPRPELCYVWIDNSDSTSITIGAEVMCDAYEFSLPYSIKVNAYCVGPTSTFYLNDSATDTIYTEGPSQFIYVTVDTSLLEPSEDNTALIKVQLYVDNKIETDESMTLTYELTNHQLFVYPAGNKKKVSNIFVYPEGVKRKVKKVWVRTEKGTWNLT